MKAENKINDKHRVELAFKVHYLYGEIICKIASSLKLLRKL